MKCTIKTLENKAAGELELSSDVFGVPVRQDIIARVVHWQLAKRRSGNHKTKGISEISGTTRKPYKQKGTGRARQGSLRSPQFRGGAVIFGPVVRSHAYSLNKKVRRLALKSALSAKCSEGKLLVLESFDVKEAKTKAMQVVFDNLGLKSALFIDGPEVQESFKRAASNIIGVDVLPQQGINVYDIMKREYLVLTKESVEYLQQRLK